MNNKRLEYKLKEKNKLHLIKFIEALEHDPQSSEIIVEKNTNMSGSPVIDGMILGYLKSLGVKVRFVKSMEKEKKLFMPKNISEEFQIKTCNNKIHYLKNEKLKEKQKIVRNLKCKRFRIDDIHFAICPDCLDFEKL